MLKSMFSDLVDTVSDYWQIKALVGDGANTQEVIAIAKLLAQAGFTERDSLVLICRAAKDDLIDGLKGESRDTP